MEKLFGVEMNVLAISLSSLMVITLVAAIILASRNRILVKLALRNIPRRKAQTVLIIVGLMLSTTIIMAALGIGDSINGGIRLGALYSLGGTDIRLTSQVSHDLVITTWTIPWLIASEVSSMEINVLTE